MHSVTLTSTPSSFFDASHQSIYFLFYSFFFGLPPDSTKLLNKNSLMER